MGAMNWHAHSLVFDDAYAAVTQAAHTGAFGANDIAAPTPAQLKAGNYAKGRATVQGLRVVIEQPEGSIRRGVDASGKEWASRMAAHYGYFEGTTGADGDAVDVFIGPFPESPQAFVINQNNPGGGFDEHKVMLGFADEAAARRAYLNSYERGWRGLGSVVPVSVPALRAWLKAGTKKGPAKDFNEERATMKKTYWNGTEPQGATLDQVLYDARRDDGADGLLLDSVSLADILEDSDGVLALDALVVENAQLARLAERLRAIMDRSGGAVKVPAVQVSEPFRARGVTNVAAVYELSDGQTVSVFFHNPDTTPNKLAPADELVSWKWLLNKKDITIVVAPEKGLDLNPRVVAMRIMKLAEKNSAAFQKANARRAERLGSIQAIRDRITEKEGVLTGLLGDIEAARLQLTERQAAIDDFVQTVVFGAARDSDADAVIAALAQAREQFGHAGVLAALRAVEIHNLPLLSKLFGADDGSGVSAVSDVQGIAATIMAGDDWKSHGAGDPVPAEPDPIALVDAAYRFASATDAFKRRVAGSIDKDDYSEFASAKAMDMKALELGAKIHWGLGAALDGIALDTAWPSANLAKSVSAALIEKHGWEAGRGGYAQRGGLTMGSATNNAHGSFLAVYDKGLNLVWRLPIDEAKALSASEIAKLVNSVKPTSPALLDGIDEEDDDFDADAEFDACPVEDGALDGDFKGHPFRGNQYKKASQHSHSAVRASIGARRAEKDGDHKAAKSAHKSAHYSHLAAAESTTGKARRYHRKMAKFHGGRAGIALDAVAEFEHAPAYTEGNGKWHSYTMEAMKRKTDAQLRYIIKDATEAAEAGEKMGNPKADQYRDEAHYASMELQRRRKGGKQVMDGATLDDASDFQDNIVGKIMKGGRIAGRAVIGGDGKAMVFVGKSVDQRVQFWSKFEGKLRDAVWSEDSGADMVAWLLNPQTAAPQPDPARLWISEEGLRNLAEPRGIAVSDVEVLEGAEDVLWAYLNSGDRRAKLDLRSGKSWLVESVDDGQHISISGTVLSAVLDEFKDAVGRGAAVKPDSDVPAAPAGADPYLVKALAETRELVAKLRDSGIKEYPSVAQFMAEVDAGNRRGYTTAYMKSGVDEARGDIEAVQAGRIAPRKIVGTGGTKKAALQWLNDKIAQYTLALSQGGFLIATNVSNYNHALKNILRGEQDDGFQSDEQIAAEQAAQQARNAQATEEARALSEKAAAARSYAAGSVDGMKKPFTVSFAIPVASERLLVSVAEAATVEEKFALLEKSGLKAGGLEQFSAKVDLNGARKRGAKFKHIEIAPRKGYSLAQLTIDLAEVSDEAAGSALAELAKQYGVYVADVTVSKTGELRAELAKGDLRGQLSAVRGKAIRITGGPAENWVIEDLTLKDVLAQFGDKASVYAFRDASDEALGLLRIGASNPAPRSTYKTAVSVEKSADAHEMAIRWVAVGALPAFDDAAGGLFGDGDQGYIRGDLSYFGVGVASVYLRDDGLTAFELQPAVSEHIDMEVEDWAGWTDAWTDVIARIREVCEDNGIAQKPAVDILAEALTAAGWKNLNTSLFMPDEDAEVALEVDAEAKPWPAVHLRVWQGDTWTAPSEELQQDVRDTRDFPPNASADEIASVVSELFADAKTAGEWLDARKSQGENGEADPSAQDRAFLLSVIDGSAPDMLEPDLATKIEAAYQRNSADAEMVSLFGQAVNAYTQAMLTATAGV